MKTTSTAFYIFLLLFTYPAYSSPLFWFASANSTSSEPKQDGATKTITFLGLSTAPVSEALREQFEFPSNHYLLVNHVKPNSPAEKAGLKDFNILLKIDDQILINEDQLKVLIRSRQAGETVEFSVMRKGQVDVIPVTLESREVKNWYHWQKRISQSFDDSLLEFEDLKSKMSDTGVDIKDRWNRFIEEQQLNAEQLKKFSLFQKNNTQGSQSLNPGKWIVKKETDDQQYTLEILDDIKRYIIQNKEGETLFDETFTDQPIKPLEKEWANILKELTQEVKNLANQSPEQESI